MSREYLDTSLELRRTVLKQTERSTDQIEHQIKRLEQNSESQADDYSTKALYAYLAGTFSFALTVGAAFVSDEGAAKKLAAGAKGVEALERGLTTGVDGRLGRKHLKQQLLQDSLSVSRELMRKSSDEGRDLLDQIRRADDSMSRAREIKG